MGKPAYLSSCFFTALPEWHIPFGPVVFWWKEVEGKLFISVGFSLYIRLMVVK